MLRLIVSCGALTSGGAERVLSILSRQFADNFDEVVYVMWVDAPVFYHIDERVKIISIEKEAGSRFILTKMRWFRSFIKDYAPAAVLSFLTPFNMLVELSTIGLNTKVIVAERNDPSKIPGGRIMSMTRNLLYRRAAGILVQTEFAGSCFPVSLADKIHVIHNPIIMEESSVGKAKRSVKENTIVSVGRLTPQKDQKTMIDAFSSFRLYHPDYRLVIYGTGPYRNELEQYIKAKGLESNVFLPGEVKNVWDHISSARMFVLTSIMEGMSNALIEAMCLGLPVISTKVAGSTDLIKDDVNGYLVNIGDVDAITSRMSLLASNPDKADEISTEAVKVYDMLKSEVILPQWIKYLNLIIDKK